MSTSDSNLPISVSDAVAGRRSVRAFLPKTVDTGLIREILIKASRSPSGGNVQPWRIVLLNGQALTDFVGDMKLRLGQPDPAEYDIYPAGLTEPYRTSRYAVGEQMYAALGIERDNKALRLQWLARNFEFFGAPTALFCFIDRQMGPPQWSDLGMYLQTVMLLLTEAGLASCSQEAWSTYNRFVCDRLGVEDELMLFCGMAIGYADKDHPVSALRTDRVPSETFLKTYEETLPSPKSRQS